MGDGVVCKIVNPCLTNNGGCHSQVGRIIHQIYLPNHIYPTISCLGITTILESNVTFVYIMTFVGEVYIE